jgi:hypothetical protein
MSGGTILDYFGINALRNDACFHVDTVATHPLEAAYPQDGRTRLVHRLPPSLDVPPTPLRNRGATARARRGGAHLPPDLLRRGTGDNARGTGHLDHGPAAAASSRLPSPAHAQSMNVRDDLSAVHFSTKRLPPSAAEPARFALAHVSSTCACASGARRSYGLRLLHTKPPCCWTRCIHTSAMRFGGMELAESGACDKVITSIAGSVFSLASSISTEARLVFHQRRIVHRAAICSPSGITVDGGEGRSTKPFGSSTALTSVSSEKLVSVVAPSRFTSTLKANPSVVSLVNVGN